MAKVSDFGISKAAAVGQTHWTTCVQGTSSQFSEKSDVYSFGVVLVELLTGQKAFRSATLVENEDDKAEERSLVEYFNSSMNNSTLYNILDPIVSRSNAKEEIMKVADIAKQCLNPRVTLIKAGYERGSVYARGTKMPTIISYAFWTEEPTQS